MVDLVALIKSIGVVVRCDKPLAKDIGRYILWCSAICMFYRCGLKEVGSSSVGLLCKVGVGNALWA